MGCRIFRRAGLTALFPALFGFAVLADAGAVVADDVSAHSDTHRAGGYVFSAERGGFEIVSASGAGTVENPIRIVKRLPGIEPVLLVIRPEKAVEPDQSLTGFAPMFMRIALRVEVINRSHLPWIGFDFELRQTLEEPSDYGDGLSFDQINSFPERPMLATLFIQARRDTEPYDRLRFRDGGVDPDAMVGFDVNIVDVSPDSVFYLLLRPVLPLS